MKPGMQAYEKTQPIGVTSLTLTNYRCYKYARLQANPDTLFKILTGPNGAGKTNLLEAISFLSPGRGLRQSGLQEIQCCDAAGNWAVACEMRVGETRVKVGTGLADQRGSGSENRRRTVRFDGETLASSNELAHHWGIAWLTPQMDRLFIEGPASRRRFLDRLVMGLYADHAREVSAYERAMRERNRLIADFGSGADRAWLSALEARMATHGVAVAVRRMDFAEQLAGQLAEQSDALFPAAELAIEGWVEGLVADGIAVSEIETLYRERLNQYRAVEAGHGKASPVGIHKSDLLVTHKAKAMPAKLCSTGEQKALLIALIIANARLQKALNKRAPILLLDEIAAHLDEERRSGLFDILTELGSECWLTGTDRSVFAELIGKADFFSIKDGEILAE